MEATQMLMVHSILIKAFLGFLFVGLILPFTSTKNPISLKKASFIYTMVFQAIATMIAFAGIVAIFTGDLGWTPTTYIMIFVWAVLMFIEIKKHKLVKVANLENSDTFNLIKGAFIKVSIIQILLVALMVVLMILKVKGVIAI